MGFDITGLGAIFDFGSSIINKIWPDANEAEKAKLRLLELQQAGEFKELEARFTAITAEANSQDKWTSRARPSFLYVVYVLLLTSIPFGICYTISPAHADKFVTGFQAWFKAIPSDLYALFGAVMMGYTFARSYEKKSGVAK